MSFKFFASLQPSYRLALCIFIAPLLLLSACQKGNLDQLEQETAIADLQVKSIKIGVSEVYLPSTNVQMPAGQSLQIHVYGVRSDGSELDISNNVDVAWILSGVGSISDSGIFSSGASAGPAAISASFAGLVTPTFDITVISDAPSGMEIWQSNETLSDSHSATVNVDLCEQMQLSAYNIYPGNVYWPAPAPVTWSYSPTTTNTNIDANGLLTSSETSPISFTVTANANNATGTRSFSGSATAPDSLRVSPNGVNLGINQSVSLSAYATYSGVERNITQAAIWTIASGGTSYVTQSPNVANTFTGVAKGSASISAECGGANIAVNISVTEKQVISIEVASPSIGDDHYIHLKAGTGITAAEQADLSVTAHFSDRSIQKNWSQNISWTTNGDTSLISFKDHNDGTATVTANLNGNKGILSITATYDDPTNTGTAITGDVHLSIE